MAEMTAQPIRVSLSLPESVERAVLLGERDMPTVDALEVTVVFENVGDAPQEAPLEEIGNGLILVYRGPDGTVFEDVSHPPPPSDGSQMTLEPQARHVERLMMEPPDEMIGAMRETAPLEVCVRWRSDWLRAQNYGANPVRWNPEIELCERTTVLVER